MRLTQFLDPNTFRVLDALINRAFHLRELAEETNLAPSTIYHVLSDLQKNRMVFVKNVKNRKVFSLNPDSILTAKAVGILMADKIIHSKAFAKLVQQKPKGVFLFGSAHTGRVSVTSDIDLAIFFEKKASAVELSKIKSSLSNELHREVDLIVLTKEKIVDMKKQETELLNQIQNKSTLLWGETLESTG